MIRLMLRAAGIGRAAKPMMDEATSLTPEEQLQRFAEVCERLPASDDHVEDPGEE